MSESVTFILVISPIRDSSVTSNETISTFAAASLNGSKATLDTLSDDRLITGVPSSSCKVFSFLLPLHPNKNEATAISKKQFFINTIINIPHSESSRKHTYHALPLLPK